jgi:hypothetical protein
MRALRRPHGIQARGQGVASASDSIIALSQEFRPLLRGRGDRSAISLPASGSWQLGLRILDAHRDHEW